MKNRVVLARIAAACVALGVVGAAGGACAQSGAAPNSFAPLVQQVAPEVVGILVTEGSGRQPAPPSLHDSPGLRDSPGQRDNSGLGDTPPGPSLPLPGRNDRGQDDSDAGIEAAGSGFIIDPAGYIVTNNHVVGNASTITVTLNDGRHYQARLIGTDQLTDLAVVKIDTGRALPATHWGDSASMRVGDWILAAGNPFALGNSYTAGIISAEGRDIGDGPFDHFLQLDAPINPGNSGGPTFNLAGAVVGVNTAIVSPSGGSVGIGFAIPSDTARRIVDDIIAHGSIARGWLGITVGDARDDRRSDRAGAVITGIEPGGPADHAGLHGNDEVVAANGRAIGSADDLIRDIASVPPGAAVHLTVLRNGRTFGTTVIVGRRPAQIGN